MPSKNIHKSYAADSYYHIYNRGVNKRDIFKDAEDYAVFLNLFKRYLSKESVKDKSGREYPWYHNDLELLAFCLMPNHYHLLVFQKEDRAITRLMRSVCTTYTMYFNKKHGRVGHLFQDRFKATRIDSDQYLEHISRYIHLNPEDYIGWQYSSLPYYKGDKKAEWLSTDDILGIFSDRDEYLKFLEDYKGHRKTLKSLKYELADR